DLDGADARGAGIVRVDRDLAGDLGGLADGGEGRAAQHFVDGEARLGAGLPDLEGGGRGVAAGGGGWRGRAGRPDAAGRGRGGRGDGRGLLGERDGADRGGHGGRLLDQPAAGEGDERRQRQQEGRPRAPGRRWIRLGHGTKTLACAISCLSV